MLLFLSLFTFFQGIMNCETLATYKKKLPSLANMHGQADIITDDLSLLERLVLPVKKIIKESV